MSSKWPLGTSDQRLFCETIGLFSEGTAADEHPGKGEVKMMTTYMKQWVFCAGLIAFSACGMMSRGDVIAYEGFDTCANGTVVGQNEGTGWGGAWTVYQVNRESVIDGGLSYTNGLVSINGGAKALEMIGGTAGYVVARTLSSNAGPTSLYVRYLYRMASDTFSGVEFDGFMFEETATDSDSFALNVAHDDETMMARLHDSAGDASVTTGSPVYDNTYLILARFDRDSGGNYTNVALWFNPDGLDEATPDAETDGTALGWIDSIGRFVLRTGGTTTSEDEMVYDELVIADSWNSALGINESIIAYDGFDSYDNGTVVDENGGFGWGAAWTGYQANRESVIDGGLSYTNGLVSINGGAKALEMIGGTPGYVVQRALSSQAGPTNLYFRYLYKMASDTFTDAEFDGWMLEENAGDSDTFSINVAQNDGAMMTRLYASGASNIATTADSPAYPNTYLILAKFERDAAGDYTKASLWINPDGTDEASPDAETDGTSKGWINSIGRILLRTGGTTTSEDKMVYDEILIADSWEGALPLRPPRGTVIMIK
jgi:hypothetical protein